MSKNPFLIERQAPWRRKIRCNTRPFFNTTVQRYDPGIFPLDSRHRVWECVAQARDHLEQRQIDIAHPLTENVFAARRIFLEYSFKVIQKLGYAILDKICRA